MVFISEMSSAQRSKALPCQLLVCQKGEQLVILICENGLHRWQTIYSVFPKASVSHTNQVAAVIQVAKLIGMAAAFSASNFYMLENCSFSRDMQQFFNCN